MPECTYPIGTGVHTGNVNYGGSHFSQVRLCRSSYISEDCGYILLQYFGLFLAQCGKLSYFFHI